MAWLGPLLGPASPDGRFWLLAINITASGNGIGRNRIGGVKTRTLDVALTIDGPSINQIYFFYIYIHTYISEAGEWEWRLLAFHHSAWPWSGGNLTAMKS